jgi:oxygen-independent coproporphyrinogen III oxidase
MSLAGLYIHIPFCRSRCSYCDFATGSYDSEMASRYINAVVKEIESFSGHDRRVDTIYFGGGTPSLLSAEQVAKILNAIYANFNIAENTEITMEMNPGTTSLGTLKEFHRLGINRASFGAQTFNNAELRSLGRVHTAEDSIQTFRDLQTVGFTNISFDLIAGLPRQSLQHWSHNLDEALSLHPTHLSLYLLEVHEGTPMAEQIKRGSQPKPDEDLAAEMYQLLIDRTNMGGYKHYEISNFSLPGYESRHNTKYWTGNPYYGFGCSAHSYDGRYQRWSNERNTIRYIEMIERNNDAKIEIVKLNDKDMQSERIFLGLRLTDGINLLDFQTQFGVDVNETYRDEIRRLIDAGLIEINDNVMRLTRSGTLLSNEVFSAFI